MTSPLPFSLFILSFVGGSLCWPGGAPRCVFAPFHVNKSTGKVFRGPSKLEVIQILIYDVESVMESKILCIFSPQLNHFSFDVKLPSWNDSGGMIELTVESKDDFLGILVTTDFYDVNLCPECQIPITYSHSHIHAHL